MDDIIIVCGLGRCGSSLTMQMLHAAGITCTGRGPAFEAEKGYISTQDPYWLIRQTNKATKILLPNLYIFKKAQYKFIWVDRCPTEQAKSTAKFLKYMAPLPCSTQTIDSLIRHYYIDKKSGINQIKKYGPVLFVNFEDIIAFPLKVTATIAEFLGRDLNLIAMTNTVLPRSTECKPNINIEISLMDKY